MNISNMLIMMNRENTAFFAILHIRIHYIISASLTL